MKPTWSSLETISTLPILAIKECGLKKKKTNHPKSKGHGKFGTPNSNPKKKDDYKIYPTRKPNEAICFYYHEKGHLKHNYSKYLEDVKKIITKGCDTSSMYMIELHRAFNSWVLDTGCVTHIFIDVHGLKGGMKLGHGELDLIIGKKKQKVVVTMVEDYV